MSLETLTWNDYKAAAEVIRVDPPAVKAIAMVESPRGAFMFYKGERRPAILFEPHKFYIYSGPKPYSRSHPHLSRRNPLPAGGYGSYNDQWDKYEEAKSLGEERAAMLSCSWGAFQIMGFNYARAGAKSVEEFVSRMWESEQAQLNAFVHFIQSDPKLSAAVRSHNWPRVAELYNGSGYKKFRYDLKLINEHKAAHAEYDSLDTSPAKTIALTGEDIKFLSDRLGVIDKAMREIKDKLVL